MYLVDHIQSWNTGNIIGDNNNNNRQLESDIC